MMLAEVGLPPGADVDRSSLDSAVADSGWDLQSCEVQPDRVVFYLWPHAGGTTFSFSLKTLPVMYVTNLCDFCHRNDVTLVQ